ncbi:MAG: WD40 repeat domain-containing protein [Chitinispirillaceae bacterium]
MIYKASLFLFFVLVTSTLSSHAHSGAVSRVSADREGHRFLSCSFDNRMKLWDVGSCSLVQTFSLPRAGIGQLFSCALSPDGRLAAVGGWYGTPSGIQHRIHLYRVRNNSFLYTINVESAVLDLQFSGDGLKIAAGLKRGGARVYDVSSGKRLAALQAAGSVYGCSFDGRGNLIVADGEGVVRVYENGNRLLSSRLLEDDAAPVSVAPSADGTLLAVGVENPASVKVLSLPSLAVVGEFRVPDWSRSGMVQVGWFGNNTVMGSYFRSGRGMNSFFFRWERQTGHLEKSALGTSGILDLGVLPDGTVLFGGQEGDLGRIDSGGAPVWHHRAVSGKKGGKFALEVGSVPDPAVVTDSVISLMVELTNEEPLVDIEVFVNGERKTSLFTQVLFELHSRRRRVLVPLQKGKNRIELWARGVSGRKASVEIVITRRDSS